MYTYTVYAFCDKYFARKKKIVSSGLFYLWLSVGTVHDGIYCSVLHYYQGCIVGHIEWTI